MILAGFLVSTAHGAVIKEIRMWHAPDRSRIVFDMDHHSRFNVFTLEDPVRVVIDLDNAVLKGRIPAPGTTGQFIRRIRQGTHDGGTTRLVFDLAKPVRYFVRMLKPSSGYQYRLVVDFYHHTYNPEKPAPDIPADRRGDRGFLVIVDPGHGGEDPGALGRKSKEKDIVLQISRRLKKLIDASPGMRAELTRTGDYYVNLRQRSALARRRRADMFVSVHADAFTSPSARGASVYALSLRGATSEAARLLANQQNLSDLAGGVNLAGKDPQVARTMLGLSMDKTIDQSILFGREVLDELENVGRIHSARVEQAGFVVLKSPDVPSILVETGYITNPTEEKLLRSDQHQQRIARAIMKGIERYLDKNPGYFSQN
ncbi:MAG: N-acetylmuramoyl-L-alanine amidase [Gammaproteobacteria bacterium]|nr:N-acetylmuramoyl-L-alanine amidase [Gammaproteobacteria bacterium]